MDKCKVDDCIKDATKKGWCNAHYLKLHKLASDYRPQERQFKKEKRSHPFYMMWFERKQSGCLSEEWLDFKNFVWDISPKPDGFFFLVRLDGTKPFGPNNFKWQEHLRKKDGESNKDWWARKREARIAANPSMERARNYKRCHGLSLEEVEQKLKNQNFVCAICKQPETAIDGRTGSIKTLALDHCHASLKARELLCGRCNTTLGKVNDNTELLQEMINYLKKHGK